VAGHDLDAIEMALAEIVRFGSERIFSGTEGAEAIGSVAGCGGARLEAGSEVADYDGDAVEGPGALVSKTARE
jgi:hypothetical protein